MLNVHNIFVSQLEKGRRVPNAEMILKIADTFDLTTDQLMRDELNLPGDSPLTRRPREAGIDPDQF
jgi:transcriptional regulator with XRE-family HTH domain